MILTKKYDFQNCFPQELLAQSDGEFFHDQSHKQLGILLTNSPDVDVKPKLTQNT